MWSGRVLVRYWAMQAPPTVLLGAILYLVHGGFDVSASFIWTVLAVWTAKDAILYPVTWRSYDPDLPAGPYQMEGARGIAIESIDPAGHVRVAGECWRAELARGARGIGKGEAVRVKGRRGLTLIVAPEHA
jgi:membrane protein implicated in regulation of membrane protease activity